MAVISDHINFGKRRTCPKLPNRWRELSSTDAASSLRSRWSGRNRHWMMKDRMMKEGTET